MCGSWVEALLVRDAKVTDLPAICDIFNQVIRDSTATFAPDPVDLADRTVWLDGRQGRGFPVRVAEADGLAGFASYGPFRSGGGYRHTVEHSVHVRSDRRGQGVGSALLAALIARARAAGCHAMVGALDAGNVASLRLHEGFGFCHVGLMPQVGAKFGRWLDLVLVQLVLDTGPVPPETHGLHK